MKAVLQFVSVGRILRCSEVPQESPYDSDVPVPKGWPCTGDINMEELTVRYGEKSDPVLHNISVNINTQEKVPTKPFCNKLFSRKLSVASPFKGKWP